VNERRRPRPVFSIWAWLVLSFYLLVSLGGYEAASTPTEWMVGIAVAVVVELLLLGVYVGVGAIEIAVADRPALRWTLVGVAILGIGVGRPALISGLQQLGGIDLVPTEMWARVVLNLLTIAAGNLLIYGLRESLDRTGDSRRRLLAVLAKLEAQAERIERTADQVSDQFQREVRGPVLDALGGLVSRRLSPRELAEELRWIAHSVVRPLSHQASRAELEDALDGVEIDARTPTSLEPVIRGLLRPSRVVAGRAWVVTAVALVLLLPPALATNGFGLGLLLALAAAAISFAGGLAIRALPLPSSPIAGLVVLMLEEIALGALVVAALLGPVWSWPLAGFYLVVGTLAYAVVATILGVITSTVGELHSHEERVVAAVARAEQRAFEARRRLAAESLSTGRLLHTEVQGDLVATSLRLRLGTADDDVLERLIERVDRLLDDPAGAEDAAMSAEAIRDGITASLNAWSLSLDLEVDVEPAALDRLAARPRAAAVAHDALGEGLTNAVRHGRGEHASVTMRVLPDDPEAVEITVANSGRLAARSPDGFGLRDLDARSREVSLAQVDGDVVLRVVV